MADGQVIYDYFEEKAKREADRQLRAEAERLGVPVVSVADLAGDASDELKRRVSRAITEARVHLAEKRGAERGAKEEEARWHERAGRWLWLTLVMVMLAFLVGYWMAARVFA